MKTVFFLIALFCLAACNLFGATIETQIRFVWMRGEDARNDFFVKSGNFQKIEGQLKSLSQKPLKFRGENPICIYRKSETGQHEVCGEVDVPAGVRNCAIILVPDWENDTEAFAPELLNLDAPKIECGELAFCNLSSLTLRVKVRGNAVEKYLPGECRKLHALDATQESGSFSFKVLASAANAKAAKRTWRYGNSMRIVKSQRYFLIALPGEPKDDSEKPPQCELITLRLEAN